MILSGVQWCSVVFRPFCINPHTHQGGLTKVEPQNAHTIADSNSNFINQRVCLVGHSSCIQPHLPATANRFKTAIPRLIQLTMQEPLPSTGSRSCMGKHRRSDWSPAAMYDSNRNNKRQRLLRLSSINRLSQPCKRSEDHGLSLSLILQASCLNQSLAFNSVPETKA